VVSGGAGIQGTYNALDPEGDGGGAPGGDGAQPMYPSRSPGHSSAKLGRRAAMHISGPHLVTVPLHITSNLALGVLQGGGGDRVIHCVRDGVDWVEGKERGGGKVEPKDEKKKEVGRKKKPQEGGGGGEEIIEGARSGGEEATFLTTETLIEDKKDEQNHMAEDRESGEKTDVQSAGEEVGESEEMSESEGAMDDDQLKPVEKAGGQGPDGEQGVEIVNSELHQDVTPDTEDDDNDEYMGNLFTNILCYLLCILRAVMLLAVTGDNC